MIVELAMPLVTRGEKITELNLTFFCVHPTGDKLKTFTTAPLLEIISLRSDLFNLKGFPVIHLLFIQCCLFFPSPGILIFPV